VIIDSLLDVLYTYEPIISAAVGLLTLLAALWGVLQFALLPLLRSRREVSAVSATHDSAPERFRFWASLIDRGMIASDDLAAEVDVRTFNIIAVFVCVATLAWLGSALLGTEVLLLSVLNFLAFMLAILAYNLHAAGRRTPAKWILLGNLLFLWVLNIVFMGAGVGLEYFLGGVLAVPLLLFRDEHRAQIYTAMALAVSSLLLALLIEHNLSFELPGVYREVLPSYYYVNALVLAALVFLILYHYNRAADESFHALEDQKQKSEELIHRIVPAYIARKISGQSTTVADWHSEASVLFATVHGFEALYQRVSAVQLVELLAEVLGEFDDLLEQRQVEKINTLGTHYVAVTGVGPEAAAHEDLALVAMGMRDVVSRFSDTVRHPFTLRVGISTGDVVSGVIGESRPSFDVWGRTVDIANAMRGNALGNTIVVNEAAYWRLRDRFEFQPCNEIEDGSAWLLLGERSMEPSARL